MAAGFCAVASFFAVLTLRGQQPDATPAVPPPVAPAVPVAPGTPAVGFFVPRTTLWLGRSMVVPFRLAQAAANDQTLAANVADASMVEILRPPVVLAGETTGFLRVRGLRVGKTRLTIHGDATLELETKTDPTAAVFSSIDAESGRPRIVSPVPDAAVWGLFAVGVEVFDANFHASIAPDAPVAPTPPVRSNAGPSASATPLPTATPSPTVAPTNTVAHGGLKVQLRLPGGRLLDPVAATGPEVGPQRHFLFNVRAEDFPAGPLSMVAVATPEGGSFVDRQTGRQGSVQESTPLNVRVLRPQNGAFWAGECENPAIMGETKELLAPARPAAVHFNTRVPEVGADPNASGGKTVQCFGGNDAWCLPFIVQSAGDYQLFIQARGDFAGGAFPSASLYRDMSETPVGSVRLAGAKYHRLPVGTPIHLDAGPQIMSVVYRNDFQHGKEDRNLYLDRYEIARVGDSAAPPPPAPGKGQPVAQTRQPQPQPPATSIRNSPTPAQAGTVPAAVADAPPRLSILYPAEGAKIYGADAVVARVSGAVGASRPAWVDLVVDGQPQGIRLLGPAAATDTVEFPLLTRQVAPGDHRITVRALDATGRATDAPPRMVSVLDHEPFMPGPYERAVFLLDRLAFGPEPRELAAVLTLGEKAWLDNRLASSYETPAEQAVLRVACQKFPRIDDEYQTSARAIAQWIGSDNPVRSRFTAWVENHFSTWVTKTKGAPKWHEHLDFCWMGVAPFADLLGVSAHSPAMLAYLDQEKSYAGKLNENYAREIMELHTLGVHGGYKQTDVTALAGVLNGWTTTVEAVLPQVDEPLGLVYNSGNEAGTWRDFRFDPYLSDGKEHRVFGLEFAASKDPAVRYDNIRLALEMLAAHPSTAEHVCRKLAEHYVGVPASDALVNSLAQAYLESGGDLRAVMRAMVAHKEFWSAPMKMATPFDFGMRVARVCRAATVQLGADPNQSPTAEQIEGFFKKSGMGLFDRVTPDGYPENNGNYADSNALLQRWRFMQTLSEHLARLVPNSWRTPPAVVTTPAANENSAGLPVVVDPLQRFIDLAAVRLTGHLLEGGSNRAALEVLGQGSADQMRETILFIALLPETSLR